MTGKDQWDVIAITAFLIALVVALMLIDENGGLMMVISLSAFDFVMVALAAFRLLHLVTYDKIFGFARNYFDRRKNDSGGFRYMDSFLDCLWCTGVWSALFALTLYCLGPWGQFIVYVFAAAGVASLLQLLSHAVSKRD